MGAAAQLMIDHPMQRVKCLIYSHHIRNRSKIKTILDLSHQYSVTGVFKVGRPGYIFIDGDEAAVHNSETAIKVVTFWKADLTSQRLRWQYISISLRETYKATQSDLYDQKMVKVETMAEIWEYMRAKQLENFFAKALGPTSKR